MIRLLMLQLILAIFSTGCSKYAEVTGKVTDKLSGQPVTGATVSVNGTNTTVTTGSDGRYMLSKVLPGLQKVEAAATGYLALNEVELTVASRTQVDATDLLLFPKPPQTGLFRVDKGLISIAPFPERGFSGYYRKGVSVHAIVPSKLPATIPWLGDQKFVLFEGDTAPNSQVSVMPLSYEPEGGGFWYLNEDAPVMKFETEKVRDGLVLLTIKLEPGRYFVIVKHQLGIEDWLFPIEIIDQAGIEQAAGLERGQKVRADPAWQTAWFALADAFRTNQPNRLLDLIGTTLLCGGSEIPTKDRGTLAQSLWGAEKTCLGDHPLDTLQNESGPVVDLNGLVIMRATVGEADSCEDWVETTFRSENQAYKLIKLSRELTCEE